MTLTPRVIDVLRVYMETDFNKIEVARRLHISRHTVYTHLEVARHHYNTSKTISAAWMARMEGLI